MTTFVPYDCTVVLYRIGTFQPPETAFPVRVLGPANASPDQLREIAQRGSAKARRIMGADSCKYLVGVRVGLDAAVYKDWLEQFVPEPQGIALGGIGAHSHAIAAPSGEHTHSYTIAGHGDHRHT
jgi:hypothetical protein